MEKLLLHTCCGPCAIHVAQKLSSSAKAPSSDKSSEGKSEDKSADYQITLFFYNPNIFPEEEYIRRLAEVKLWSNKNKFELIEGDYDHQKWQESVKGLENEPEGGRRCLLCYQMRLEESARYAKENGFEYLASTLTIGRNKKADVINPIGVEVATKYDIKFLEEDWKKKGGQEEACRMSKEENMYRQSYCGCEYSVRIPSFVKTSEGKNN